jgi:general secretion pathway protein G
MDMNPTEGSRTTTRFREAEPEPTRRNYSTHTCFLITFAAIVGLGMVLLILPNLLQEFAVTSCPKAESEFIAIDRALEDYAAANGGRFPDSLEALVEPDVNGHTFLDMNHVPKDRWGNEYIYLPPTPANPLPRVLCYGKDGQPGGKGDDADIDGRSILGQH